MAKLLKENDPQYKKDRVEDIITELQASSDWELHSICSARTESLPALSPYCLKPEQVNDTSGKFIELKKLLPDLEKNGHRVLIFSQMVKMMNILEYLLDEMGYLYLRLDGSTPVSERQDLINDFNTNKKYFIFLLSTKAGG